MIYYNMSNRILLCATVLLLSSHVVVTDSMLPMICNVDVYVDRISCVRTYIHTCVHACMRACVHACSVIAICAVSLTSHISNECAHFSIVVSVLRIMWEGRVMAIPFVMVLQFDVLAE